MATTDATRRRLVALYLVGLATGLCLVFQPALLFPWLVALAFGSDLLPDDPR